MPNYRVAPAGTSVRAPDGQIVFLFGGLPLPDYVVNPQLAELIANGRVIDDESVPHPPTAPSPQLATPAIYHASSTDVAAGNGYIQVTAVGTAPMITPSSGDWASEGSDARDPFPVPSLDPGSYLIRFAPLGSSGTFTNFRVVAYTYPYRNDNLAASLGQVSDSTLTSSEQALQKGLTHLLVVSETSWLALTYAANADAGRTLNGYLYIVKVADGDE